MTTIRALTESAVCSGSLYCPSCNSVLTESEGVVTCDECQIEANLSEMDAIQLHALSQMGVKLPGHDSVRKAAGVLHHIASKVGGKLKALWRGKKKDEEPKPVQSKPRAASPARPKTSTSSQPKSKSPSKPKAPRPVRVSARRQRLDAEHAARLGRANAKAAAKSAAYYAKKAASK